MELLLNLSWLLLAMPALWLWRESVRAPGGRRFSALQRVFCLACALLVLFPVVSATDDLRAMRTEMEESPTGKRSAGHCSNERGSTPKSQAQPPVVVASLSSHIAFEHGWLSAVSSLAFIAESHLPIRAGRAPPQLQIT